MRDGAASHIALSVEAWTHIHFAERAGKPAGAQWVPSFYESLLRSFGVEVDARCRDDGCNNDYLAMGQAVLRALKDRCELNELSHMFVAHQTFDTHYPFQSTATMLCNEFEIPASAVVMTEQDDSTPYIALWFLLLALKRGQAGQSGLFLIVDQSSMPFRRFANAVDTALAIKVETREVTGSGVSVDGMHVWHDGNGGAIDWISEQAEGYLAQRQLSPAEVCIAVEPRLRAQLETRLPWKSAVPTDPRYMSAGGLVAVFGLLEQQAPPVLLLHYSSDRHLFMFFFCSSYSKKELIR